VSAEREDEPDAPERPRAGRGLRLIKTPEVKRPEPAPEMKAILDDIRRRYRAHRGRAERDPGGKDVA
jgi:hypothetical protein